MRSIRRARPSAVECCAQEESAVSKWCAFDLFVSQDFGRHWQNLTASSGGRVASFWDFDWGANVAKESATSFTDETILATVYESAAHMKGPYPGWDKDMQFVTSHDFFKSSHTKLVPCGNQFEVRRAAGTRAPPLLPPRCIAAAHPGAPGFRQDGSLEGRRGLCQQCQHEGVELLCGRTLWLPTRA